MILSFSNNFIFLRTRKTGGTSTELVLSSWCREPDVCSRVHEDDEAHRARIGGLKPRKYYHGRRIYNHMEAALVAKRVPRFWNQAFSFAVERHPYEKVVSRAYWNIARWGGCFEEEVEQVLRARKYLDREIYMIDGEIAVSKLIRYDELWDWLGDFALRKGYALPEEVPRLKGQHRRDRRPAADILTAAQKRRIQACADFEFAHFGFEP